MKKYEIKITDNFFGEFKGWFKATKDNKAKIVKEMVENWAFELGTDTDSIEVLYVKEVNN